MARTIDKITSPLNADKVYPIKYDAGKVSCVCDVDGVVIEDTDIRELRKKVIAHLVARSNLYLCPFIRIYKYAPSFTVEREYVAILSESVVGEPPDHKILASRVIVWPWNEVDTGTAAPFGGGREVSPNMAWAEAYVKLVAGETKTVRDRYLVVPYDDDLYQLLVHMQSASETLFDQMVTAASAGTLTSNTAETASRRIAGAFPIVVSDGKQQLCAKCPADIPLVWELQSMWISSGILGRVVFRWYLVCPKCRKYHSIPHVAVPGSGIPNEAV